MMGASDREIADVPGHKSIQMARRYSHLVESPAHGWMKKVSERMGRLDLGQRGYAVCSRDLE